MFRPSRASPSASAAARATAAHSRSVSDETSTIEMRHIRAMMLPNPEAEYEDNDAEAELDDERAPIVAIAKTLAQRAWKVPRKTMLLSIFLLIVGLIFTVLGLSVLLTTWQLNASLPFLCIGCLTLTPGLYHCALIICALTNSMGVTVKDIPNYDR